MTMRTVVSVYAVGENGGTGEQIGVASLLNSFLALAHPPLSQQLADNPRALRVGIAAPGGGRPEVIDVHEVLAVDDSAGPIVAVQLVRDSVAPVEIPVEDDEFLVESAVRAVLASGPPDVPVGCGPEVPDRPVPTPVPAPDDGPAPPDDGPSPDDGEPDPRDRPLPQAPPSAPTGSLLCFLGRHKPGCPHRL